MKDKDELLPPKLSKIVLLGPPVFLARFLYLAWAYQVIWNWYVPPIFGVPPLIFPHALGLALLVLIIGRGSDWGVSQAAFVLLKKENPELYSAACKHSMVRTFGGPLLLMAFAWVLKTVWPVI